MAYVYRFMQFACTALLLLSWGCDRNAEQKISEPTEIHIREASEPDGLHPVNSKGNLAQRILSLTHQKLMVPGQDSIGLEPLLVTSPPGITALNDQLVKITYHIRPKAAWTGGSPVTANDVVFSFKAAANPESNNALLRNKLKPIQKVYVDSADSKTVHIIAKRAPRLQWITGNQILILPKAFYDSTGTLNDIDFHELDHSLDSLDILEQKNLDRFSMAFNSTETGYMPGRIRGSGPYKLREWQPGQKLVLERKDKPWTGDMSGGPAIQLAHSARIEYDFIADDNTALSALRNGYIDVLRGLNSQTYSNLETDSAFKSRFYMKTGPWRQMNAIAINCCAKNLDNPALRKALAHLVNKKAYIREVLMGKGQPLCSFLHPSRSYSLPCPSRPWFNPANAKQILDSLGWKARDKSGIRKKNGERLSFTYLYNQGNEGRKHLGLMLRQAAKEAGIQITLEPVLWSNYLSRLFSGDYQLAFVSLTDEWGPPDPGSMFSSKLTYGQGNVMCYRDARTDSLLAAIEEEQGHLRVPRRTLQSLQKRIIDQSPIIPVSTNINRVIFSRRLEEPELSAHAPGYLPGALRVSGGTQK